MLGLRAGYRPRHFHGPAVIDQKRYCVWLTAHPHDKNFRDIPKRFVDDLKKLFGIYRRSQRMHRRCKYLIKLRKEFCAPPYQLKLFTFATPDL